MEQKIIGYNLNELGEKHKARLSAFIGCVDIVGMFEPESMIAKVLKDAKILETYTTPVFDQPKYKEGEWVYGVNSLGLSFVSLVDRMEDEMVWMKYVFFGDGGIDESKRYWLNDRIKGIATEEQKLQHFSAAAIKKGYVEGVKVKSMFYDRENVIDGSFTLHGVMRENLMANGSPKNTCIFNEDTLQWAEIVQPKEESYITASSENVQIKTAEQIRLDEVEESIREIRRHLNL